MTLQLSIQRSLRALLLLLLSALTASAQDLAVTGIGETLDGRDIEVYGLKYGTVSLNYTTTICNEGNASVLTGDAGEVHPVIGQNLYRISEGRIEQIGQGFVKHRVFPFLNFGICGVEAGVSSGTSFLSPGVSDTYGAKYISYGPDGWGYDEDGPKYQVNPTTGALELPYLYPPCATFGFGGPVSHIEVEESDLDPNLNAGAVYLAEAQVISQGDALAGNSGNNVSFRMLDVNAVDDIDPLYGTIKGFPAIYMLGFVHPGPKKVTEVVNENEGGLGLDSRMYVACAVTELPNGLYRYEYAVQNLDSHQGIRSLRIPADCAYLQLSDFDQHHVDYGCGEIWRSDDWSTSLESGVLEFSTGGYTGQESQAFDMQSYGPNNAGDPSPIRWGTMSNFAFTATTPPQEVEVELGLFRPGSTMSLKATTLGPCKDLECSFERYCDTTPHSAGRGAFMQAAGSTSVSENDLFLWSNSLPSNGFGYFFCGPEEINHPFSLGTLCVGGGINFIPQPVEIVGNGVAVMKLDLAGGTPGVSPNLITPGSAWNFQFYYRDTPPGTSGEWRLTDAMRIHFCQ